MTQVTAAHAHCEHFLSCANPEHPDQGRCEQLEELLRQTCNTTVARVMVEATDDAAEVDLSDGGCEDATQVMKGCPYISLTTEAMDEFAEQLQSPYERFGVNPTDFT